MTDAPLPDPLRDGAVILTSGSTGVPKRVVLSAAAFRASAAAAAAELGEPGRWVLTLPTDYVAGLNVLARAAAWGRPPILAVGGPRFSAMGFAAVTLGVEEPLYASLVPIQLQRLMDSVPGLAALRRFRRILVGGQAPDPALLTRARQEGLPVTVTYGMSETCGGVVWDGRPIGDAEVRLEPLSSGAGRILIGGPTLAEGYQDEDGRLDAERTAEAFVELDDRRWHRTNDLGEWDGDRLRVLGRLDDLIVSGGLKVSLSAVQAVVRELPGLADAVAVAVDREAWGQAPAVVSTGDVDLALLRDRVEERLGAAARPVAFRRVAEIPLTGGGKADAARIRALLGGPDAG